MGATDKIVSFFRNGEPSNDTLRMAMDAAEHVEPICEYTKLGMAAHRVRMASNRRVGLQAELHRADMEYDAARNDLARMTSNFGIVSTVDGEVPPAPVESDE